MLHSRFGAGDSPMQGMDMARNGVIWQGLTLALTVLVLSAGGCAPGGLLSAQGPLIGEPKVPDPGGMSVSGSYRDLSTIPAKPPKTESEAQQKALDSLDAERAATAEAADGLRKAPFDTPAPPSAGPEMP
jgi:hypothetical protein